MRGYLTNLLFILHGLKQIVIVAGQLTIVNHLGKSQSYLLNLFKKSAPGLTAM